MVPICPPIANRRGSQPYPMRSGKTCSRHSNRQRTSLNDLVGISVFGSLTVERLRAVDVAKASPELVQCGSQMAHEALNVVAVEVRWDDGKVWTNVLTGKGFELTYAVPEPSRRHQLCP